MSPSRFPQNISDVVFVTQIHPREHLMGYPIRDVRLSDGQNIFARKSGATRQFSYISCLSVFFHFIQHIVFRRSSKQMRRINTTRIVTFVANKQSFANFTNVKFKRKSVGFYVTPIQIKSPIPFNIARPNPNPTTSFFSHRRIKAGLQSVHCEAIL